MTNSGFSKQDFKPKISLTSKVMTGYALVLVILVITGSSIFGNQGQFSKRTQQIIKQYLG